MSGTSAQVRTLIASVGQMVARYEPVESTRTIVVEIMRREAAGAKFEYVSPDDYASFVWLSAAAPAAIIAPVENWPRIRAAQAMYAAHYQALGPRARHGGARNCGVSLLGFWVAERKRCGGTSDCLCIAHCMASLVEHEIRSLPC